MITRAEESDIKIAVMDVLTIRLQYKRNELVELTRNNNINIFVIGDHNIFHEEMIRNEKHDKLTLITYVWRNINNYEME